jgi:hypothetical protein
MSFREKEKVVKNKDHKKKEGTWSNTWAMPPVPKSNYSHLLSHINVQNENFQHYSDYLQLLIKKWWMRPTEYKMGGRTLENSKITALIFNLCNIIWKWILCLVYFFVYFQQVNWRQVSI